MISQNIQMRARVRSRLPAIVVVVGVFCHGRGLPAQDLTNDGVVDIQDAELASDVEQLESILQTAGLARGELDGGRFITFADFLILFNTYGSTGLVSYRDGDLDVDGLVGFEDFAIFATNFGATGHRRPPPRRPQAGAIELRMEDDGTLLLSGDGIEISGVRFRSDSGLEPGAPGDAGPFQFVLHNTATEVAYGNLGSTLSIDGEVSVPVSLPAFAELSEVDFVWSELESYDVFPLSFPIGDFDFDGLLTATDIDLLGAAVLAGEHPTVFDLNEDELVNEQDRGIWVEDLARTFFGDSDLNGAVEFADFLTLSSHFGDPSGWAAGDFDGNGLIEFGDFLLLSANFGATAAASPVPEPGSGWILVVFATLHAAGCRSRPER